MYIWYDKIVYLQILSHRLYLVQHYRLIESLSYICVPTIYGAVVIWCQIIYVPTICGTVTIRYQTIYAPSIRGTVFLQYQPLPAPTTSGTVYFLAPHPKNDICTDYIWCDFCDKGRLKCANYRWYICIRPSESLCANYIWCNCRV